MKNLTPFPNEDLKLIRSEIIVTVISILICTGIYLGSNYLKDEMNAEVNIARAGLRQAISDVELIEEEEATIIEYIDRYQEILDEGAIESEDRVQILETFAEIRSEYSLFPIDFMVDKQVTLPLQYDPSVREPGGPIELKASSIVFSLPLLHEGDLTHLLDSIVNSPGVFQTQQCEINVKNGIQNFNVLAQHQNATCTLIWYSFDIDPLDTENPNSG